MEGFRVPKLDPLHIPDPLYRAMLYREIRAGHPDWDRWEVSIDESLRPELISLRYYSTDALKFVVAVAASLDDLRQSIPAGTKLTLPPARWVRQRIRHYQAISPEDKAKLQREDVARNQKAVLIHTPEQSDDMPALDLLVNH